MIDFLSGVRGGLFLLSAFLLATHSLSVSADKSALYEEVQTVKKSVIELQKELDQLEQDLINPATIRADFHFSLSFGQYFSPLSLVLKVDDENKLQHIYTELEVNALKSGAIQPVGGVNMSPGQHKVTVILKGKNRKGEELTLSEEALVTKNNKKLVTEVKVVDLADSKSTKIEIVHW